MDHNVVILWRILAFLANFWIFSSMKKNVDSGHKIKNKIKTKFRSYFQLYFQWLNHFEVTNNNEICVKLKQKHQFTFYVLVSLWKFDIVKLKRRWYLLSSSIRQSVDMRLMTQYFLKCSVQKNWSSLSNTNAKSIYSYTFQSVIFESVKIKIFSEV